MNGSRSLGLKRQFGGSFYSKTNSSQYWKSKSREKSLLNPLLNMTKYSSLSASSKQDSPVEFRKIIKARHGHKIVNMEHNGSPKPQLINLRNSQNQNYLLKTKSILSESANQMSKTIDISLGGLPYQELEKILPTNAKKSMQTSNDKVKLASLLLKNPPKESQTQYLEKKQQIKQLNPEENANDNLLKEEKKQSDLIKRIEKQSSFLQSLKSQQKPLEGRKQTTSRKQSSSSLMNRSSSNLSIARKLEGKKTDESKREEMNQTFRSNKSSRTSINPKMYVMADSEAIKKDSDQRMTIKEIQQYFKQSQQKLFDLLQEKWSIIEFKLLNQAKAQERNNSMKNKELEKGDIQAQHFRQTSRPENKKRFHTISLKDISAKSRTQKQIDEQIVKLIKGLVRVDLDNLRDLSLSESENKKIVDQLTVKKEQIIDRALAESMVESEMIRKYFFNVHSKALNSSNLKVGQHISSEIGLKTSRQSSAQNKETFKYNSQITNEPSSDVTSKQRSITLGTENRELYREYNKEDFEKYRYKHPFYQPNLQPLPRSAYQREFLKSDKYQKNYQFEPQETEFFPQTLSFSKSSYQDQFKQLCAGEMHDIKKLDAKHDKFRPLEMNYVPKKRVATETCSLRSGKLGSKNGKRSFYNQVEHAKRLKTQNLLVGLSKFDEVKKKMAGSMFLTESRKQYPNEEETKEANLQSYFKSEAKHKNLNKMRWELKSKFHV